MNIEQFLARCAAYCGVKPSQKMSESRLSTIIFGSGVTIRRLREGKQVTVRVLERAEARLAGLERGDRPRDVLADAQPVAA